MSQRAIEALMRDRANLMAERQKITDEIYGIETAIEKLSGKTVWEFEKETTYDYIKGTEDGI